MTSISAASINTYQSPLQKLQDELLSEVKSGAIKSSDQDALASALTDINSAMQASRASDQASGTRPSPDRLKSKIDDLIAGEVSSGKLTSDQATELQGIFKAAFANGPGGAGGPPSGWSRRSAASRWRVLERRLFVEHDVDRRHSQTVPAIAPGIAVGVIIDDLRRNRQFKHEQQRFLHGVADRLSKLSPRNAFSREADKATQQPSFPKGKDGCLIFGGGNRAAVVTLVPLQDVWRVQWQATS